MSSGQDENQPPADVPPEAPDSDTLEKIRLRRLAKLGTSSSPKPADDASSSDPQSAGANETKRPEATTTTQPPAGGQTTEIPKRTINITPGPGSGTSGPGSQDPVKHKRAAAKIEERTTPVQQPAAKKPNMSAPEPLEEWSDRVLSSVLRVTVKLDHLTDAHGHKLIFIPGVNQDLSDEGQPLRLSQDTIAAALLEAATAQPHGTPLLSYLVPSFKRCQRAISSLKEDKGSRREVLEEAKRLCVSYILFALTMPDLFGREHPDKLETSLLLNYEQEASLSMELVKEMIDRFEENEEEYPKLFADAMASISTRLEGMTMEQDYRPCLNALVFYTRFPKLLSIVAQHPRFLLGPTGPRVESSSILGPFFRLSPLQADVILTYFPNPRSIERGRATQSQETLRTILRVHQDELFAISNAFIRADAETRNRILDWFALSVNVNHKRRAMQVDPKEVSSDGFMMNLTVVLDRFCSPFMDTTFSKVGRIEVDYFRRNPRVAIRDETKINADQATSDAFLDKTDGKSSNFISEVFFLTLAAHHYGSGATNAKLKNLEREIKHFEKSITSMEAERPKVASNPAQAAMLELSLKRYTKALERAIASKYAIEGVFLDEKMQELSLRFMRYVAVWMLRLASQSDYTPDTDLQLPLPSPQPEAFACLPEYALQDVVDNFKFVYRHIPQIMPSAIGSEMIALCVAFLESSDFIKNPYLKSSLVTLLFSGTWPFSHFKKGVLGDQLYGSKFANDHLLHALMKFYIEAESTGTHNQFYDKFNIRYEIFQVIKTVWGNDVYKQQLTRESKVNKQFFVQFVNMLLNDATYVLDEALTKFPKIHNLQHELDSSAGMSQEDREKKQEELQSLEGQAGSFMQLANETLSMMKLFTSALDDAFTMPEIVQRLASMLNYNLETLAGPKMGQLKVNNPQKYNFLPRVLLSDFVEIYINLGAKPNFVDAVAADGRCYKPETFEKAHYILTKRMMKDETDLQKFETLMGKFKEAKDLADQAELDLGEIPAEFEDPILGDLMRDPVILPSQHIVDRSTIVQHLLSDPKDPFTRQPMTADDVIPDTTLKERIEAWKRERIEASKAAKAGGQDGSDAMDMTEG